MLLRLEKNVFFHSKGQRVFNSCCDTIISLQNSNTVRAVRLCWPLWGNAEGKYTTRTWNYNPRPCLESLCIPHPVSTAAGNAEESTISHRQLAVVTRAVSTATDTQKRRKNPTRNRRREWGIKVNGNRHLSLTNTDEGVTQNVIISFGMTEEADCRVTTEERMTNAHVHRGMSKYTDWRGDPQCIQLACGNYSPFNGNTAPAGCFATHEIAFMDNYEWARSDTGDAGCLSIYGGVIFWFYVTLMFLWASGFYCQSHNIYNPNNHIMTLVLAGNALQNMIYYMLK